jgi:hypothetical protein
MFQYNNITQTKHKSVTVHELPFSSYNVYILDY